MKTKIGVLVGVLSMQYLLALPADAVVFMATDDISTAGLGDGSFAPAFQSGNFLKDEYQVDGTGAATGLNALAGGADPKWRASTVQFDLTGLDVGSIISANLVMDLRDNRAGAGETQGPATVRIRMLTDSEDGWVDDDLVGVFGGFTPQVSLADGGVEVEVEATGPYAWDVMNMLTGSNGLNLNPIVGFVVDTTTPVFDKVIFQDLEDNRGFGSEILGPFLDVSLPGLQEFHWKEDVSGDWTSAGNWSELGGSPNSVNDRAIFGDVIGSAQTVFTNVAVTVHSIQFDNPNTYVVGGAGSVNLAANTVSSISVTQGEHQFQAIVNLQTDTTVDVNSGSTLIFNNALDLMGNTLTKTGNGEIAVRNDLTMGGGTIDVQQGMVTGNGTIGGDVINDGGTISPGNSGTLSVVPEPATLMLLCVGLLGLVVPRVKFLRVRNR